MFEWEKVDVKHRHLAALHEWLSLLYLHLMPGPSEWGPVAPKHLEWLQMQGSEILALRGVFKKSPKFWRALCPISLLGEEFWAYNATS